MSDDTLAVRVEALYVYPIKACAGLPVCQLEFRADGSVRHDREWVVVDATGQVVWQGSHPRLALARPEIDGKRLVVHAAGQPPVTLALDHASEQRKLRIWNDRAQRKDEFSGFDAGDPAARLLARLTGDPGLRLVRLDPSALTREAVNPVHLVSLASLSELNQALDGAPGGGGTAADLLRLRPNIAIAGAGEGAGQALMPFIEDHFVSLSWQSPTGPRALRIQGRCVRCIVPNVDPWTAEAGAQPLRAITRLSAQRFPGEPVCFGIHGRADQAGTLSAHQRLSATLNF